MNTPVRNGIIALSVFVASVSVVWAATSTVKYFQHIKQTTYAGTIEATVTAGDESQKTLEAIPQNGCIADEAGSATCELNYQDTEYYREYSATLSGVPRINTDTDPPTFYIKRKYYLNGKRVGLLEESDGAKTYRFKTVRVHTFADGHTTEEILPGVTLPTVGTKTYTYKITTLQPR